MYLQKGDRTVKREGMETLSSICKKDRRYKDVIKDCYLVKNAVILLGGRRSKREEREEMGRAEGEEGERRKEGEGKGGMEVDCIEMRVGEKILLIELLSELVKRGVEIVEEEEMKEVLMELEEEGNKHAEEEMEGEEKEEEKMEWEELSERARNLVWVMEKMKNRREGKKTGTLKMMKKKEEDLEKRVEEERRGREEENKRADAEKKTIEEEKRRLEERIERMREEIEEMKRNSTLYTQLPSTIPAITKDASDAITALDKISVTFPQPDNIRREGNTIIHQGYHSQRNCFVGGEMTSV